MTNQQHNTRIIELSFFLSIVLLFAIIRQCNATSYGDGPDTDWFRKNAFRSDGPAENSRWFGYGGNRNWFGRSSFSPNWFERISFNDDIQGKPQILNISLKLFYVVLFPMLYLTFIKHISQISFQMITWLLKLYI